MLRLCFGSSKCCGSIQVSCAHQVTGSNAKSNSTSSARPPPLGVTDVAASSRSTTYVAEVRPEKTSRSFAPRQRTRTQVARGKAAETDITIPHVHSRTGIACVHKFRAEDAFPPRAVLRRIPISRYARDRMPGKEMTEVAGHPLSATLAVEEKPYRTEATFIGPGRPWQHIRRSRLDLSRVFNK